MSNAINCHAIGGGSGTAKAKDLHDAFGGTWFAAGTFSGSGEGTNNWLTFDIVSGSWGSLPVSGTWAIDPILWQLHPRAALSFHLGNGGGNPDWFMFEIEPGELSGTFDIVKLSGNGGGFSNIVLWADPPGDGFCTDRGLCTRGRSGTGFAAPARHGPGWPRGSAAQALRPQVTLSLTHTATTAGRPQGCPAVFSCVRSFETPALIVAP